MTMPEKIWRDSHGVCHVDGKDREEAFELMGYAHGRDRGDADAFDAYPRPGTDFRTPRFE